MQCMAVQPKHTAPMRSVSCSVQQTFATRSAKASGSLCKSRTPISTGTIAAMRSEIPSILALRSSLKIPNLSVVIMATLSARESAVIIAGT